MALSILGAATIILYYMAVVTVGVWAGRKVHKYNAHTTRFLHACEAAGHAASARIRGPVQWHHKAVDHLPAESKEADNEYLLRLFLANRNVSFTLGFISMTATWVGGGYINGTAEAVFNYGIVWCQAPLGYALSLIIGGWFFAGKMRVTKALTMLDPFQQHYGPWIAVLLCVPAICGELFWTAAILAALGDTVAITMNIDSTFFIVMSSFVILFYTSLGGLYAVIYTDVFQIIVAVIGLWTSLTFFLTNEAVGTIGAPHNDWVGAVHNRDVSQALDQLFMTVLGGIPWQVYFQRVLSSSCVFHSKILSYLSALGCCFLAIPSVLIGAAGKSANFTAAGYRGPFNLLEEHRKDVLPYAMRYMNPEFASLLGLLAITGAVMSSVDSSMLSASTLITRNIYHFIIRPKASDMEVCIVLRTMVCLIGAVATAMALNVGSVFDLWTLSSDLVYVLLFPQFVAYFFVRNSSNAYGAVLGFLVGLFTRILCGEPLLGVPVMLRLPMYDHKQGQQFPFRTLCMLLSLCVLLVASVVADVSFRTGLIPPKFDVWRCFSARQRPPGADTGAPPATSGMADSAPAPVPAPAFDSAPSPDRVPIPGPAPVQAPIPDTISVSVPVPAPAPTSNQAPTSDAVPVPASVPEATSQQTDAVVPKQHLKDETASATSEPSVASSTEGARRTAPAAADERASRTSDRSRPPSLESVKLPAPTPAKKAKRPKSDLESKPRLTKKPKM